jgi:transketolase
MKCWVPAFSDDVEPIVEEIFLEKSPAYLRLGNSRPSSQRQARVGQFNQVLKSKNAKVTIIVLGPLVVNMLEALKKNNLQNEVDLFTAITFPVKSVAPEIIESINKTKKIMVVEEHVEVGGLAQAVALRIAEMHLSIDEFIALNAKQYPSELYGDQSFHQKESGLDTENMSSELIKLI